MACSKVPAQLVESQSRTMHMILTSLLGAPHPPQFACRLPPRPQLPMKLSSQSKQETLESSVVSIQDIRWQGVLPRKLKLRMLECRLIKQTEKKNAEKKKQCLWQHAFCQIVLLEWAWNTGTLNHSSTGCLLEICWHLQPFCSVGTHLLGWISLPVSSIWSSSATQHTIAFRTNSFFLWCTMLGQRPRGIFLLFQGPRAPLI